MPLKDCTRISIEEACKPKAGLHMIYVDAWWMVTPGNEILIYRGSSPQCNQNQKIAERIRDKLYPGFEVRQLAIVFHPVRIQDYWDGT